MISSPQHAWKVEDQKWSANHSNGYSLFPFRVSVYDIPLVWYDFPSSVYTAGFLSTFQILGVPCEHVCAMSVPGYASFPPPLLSSNVSL
jgi:hypothetical protein